MWFPIFSTSFCPLLYPLFHPSRQVFAITICQFEFHFWINFCGGTRSSVYPNTTIPLILVNTIAHTNPYTIHLYPIHPHSHPHRHPHTCTCAQIPWRLRVSFHIARRFHLLDLYLAIMLLLLLLLFVCFL